MKCICELIKEGHSEKLSVGDWNDIYIRKEYGKYYIEAIADGNAYLKLNYCCPKCGFHFGLKLYENILAEGKCPNTSCRCKFTGK